MFGFDVHRLQAAAHLTEDIARGLVLREALLEVTEHFGQRHPLAFARGGIDEGGEHLLYAADLAEALVLLHQLCRLLVVEPEGMAVLELCQQLGVELRIIDGGGEVDGVGDVDAEIAAGAGGVDEWPVAIGGGYEGGEAAAHLQMGGKGEAHVDIVLRDEELQQGMLRARELVELVDIDEGAARHGQGDGGVALQVEVLGIEGAQLPGQQDAAETGLAGALPARQKGHQGVAVVAIAAHPAGYHAQQPGVEERCPVGRVGGDSPG